MRPIAILFWLIGAALGVYEPSEKCSLDLCPRTDFCDRIELECKPCLEVCDPKSGRLQPDVCVQECNDFLHDQRHILKTDLNQIRDLKGHAEQLRVVFDVTVSLICVAVLVIVFMLGKAFAPWKSAKEALRRIFRRDRSTTDGAADARAEIVNGGQSV